MFVPVSVCVINVFLGLHNMVLLLQGLEGSAARYVQHLLASTSGSPDAESAGCLREAEPSPGWPEAAAVELRLSFSSQCEHHLLPFQGTVQVIAPFPIPQSPL